jgi:hypothetical protein
MDKVTRVLLENQIDYDFVPADTLADTSMFALSDKLAINGESFDALIIPHRGYITDSVRKFMADAEKTGKITYLLDNTLVPDQPIVAAVHEGYTRNIGILIDRWNGKPLVQMTKEG